MVNILVVELDKENESDWKEIFVITLLKALGTGRGNY